MDKGLIVKIAVVFFALLFLLEPFAMTVQNWAGKGGTEGEYFSGSANVNITVYSYSAYLYASALTDLQKTQVSGNPQVLGIDELDDGVFRITLRDSSMAAEVFSELRGMGINSLAVAQIGLPEEYALTLGDGSRLNISGGYQQLLMEPVMPTGRKASYLISVETDGTGTYRITDAKRYMSEVEIEAQAIVENASQSAYKFSVEWEERGLVDVEGLESEYGEENVAYEENDYILFEPTLSMEETMVMKRDYMTYISGKSATVDSGFTDRARVEEDFQGRAAFPNSTLTIKSSTLPELDYDHTQVRTYTVSFAGNPGEYYVDAGRIEIASMLDLEPNQSITLLMNATVTGDTVLGIKGIAIKQE